MHMPRLSQPPRQPTPQTPPLIYRIKGAMQAIGQGRSTIYKYIAEGELQTVHFGRAVGITADSLHALIQRRTDPVKQPPAPSETQQLLEKALARVSGKPRKSKAKHGEIATLPQS
jgi:predicted DNA-binding transcriptional regulator AlpA